VKPEELIQGGNKSPEGAQYLSVESLQDSVSPLCCCPALCTGLFKFCHFVAGRSATHSTETLFYCRLIKTLHYLKNTPPQTPDNPPFITFGKNEPDMNCKPPKIISAFENFLGELGVIYDTAKLKTMI
jgi:hypothetical protein